jgi:hypothetical protein
LLLRGGTSLLLDLIDGFAGGAEFVEVGPLMFVTLFDA